jgi:hypothetical protein
MSLQPGSIYKESFERWMGWALPYHLAQVWEDCDMNDNVRAAKRDWWIATNQTDKLWDNNEEENGDNLTLKHISGAFYALFGCLLMCLGVFCQEFVVFYGKERKLKIQQRWARANRNVTMLSRVIKNVDML